MRKGRYIAFAIAALLVSGTILNPVTTVYAEPDDIQTEGTAADTEETPATSGTAGSTGDITNDATSNTISDTASNEASDTTNDMTPDPASAPASDTTADDTSGTAGTPGAASDAKDPGSDPESDTNPESKGTVPSGSETSVSSDRSDDPADNPKAPESSNSKEESGNKDKEGSGSDSSSTRSVSSDSSKENGSQNTKDDGSVSKNGGVSDNSSDGSVLKSSVSADKTSLSANKTTVSDPSVITAIDPVEIKEVNLEYKTTIASLQEELPESITVHRGETSEILAVSWNCAKDYNKTFEEYPFVPDLGKEKVLPEVTLPTIMIHFEHDDEGTTGGYIEDPDAYGADVIGAGRGLLRASASSYNGYTKGYLPNVRSQGSEGACWAFASVGSTEADLIHDGAADKGIDLSEIHLAYYATHNYTDPKGCRSDSVSSTGNWLTNGGNSVQAYRLFSNHVGVVKESDAPYSQRDSYNPGTGKAISMDYVHVKNAFRMNPSDREAIKSAIQGHYGVSVSYADYNSCYNSTYAAYYCDESGFTNHAVMLVGWDDNFPRDHFTNRPSGNGAWLVRNSWGGGGYGHSGYFWLSYYDKSLLGSKYVVAFDADRELFDNCYAYDGQPVFDTIIPAASNQAVTETYRVSGGETIKGVGYEVATANVTANVTVTDKTHNKSVNISNRTTYPGFYTVPVTGLDFREDSEVEVSIRYSSTSDEVVEIVAENTGYSSFGNTTYRGVCDKGVTIGSRRYSFDPRMKLYTDDKYFPVVMPTGVTLNRSSMALTAGQGGQLTATVLPSDATYTTVTWSSNNTSVATVNSSGYVTAVKAGTAVITAKTTNNKTATCTVTVSAAAPSSVAVTGVSLSATSLSLTKGYGAQLTATVWPTNATNKTVTWSSSNTSVATVNSSGYVTGKGVGSAVITARTADGGKTAVCNVTVTSSNTPAPNVSVYYRTHVQNVGWQGYVSNGAVSGTSGRSLRLEGINVYLRGNTNLGVQYTTHCQDYGWLAWSANNEMSGTEGESKRLEAIMINLTGADNDKYDIYYRVHAQDVGWMGWAKNGEAAGTAGYSRRLEAIQIQVVKKGASINTNAAGIYSVTSQAYISSGGDAPSVPNSTIPNLSYRTHVQDVGWQGWRTNGQFAGTSGRSLRLEGINIKLSNKKYSGGIRYSTHVQDIGWQGWMYDGAMSGTSGRSLRLEAIKIELYGDMAKYYDIYYRVHAQDVGWMGWAKNGGNSGTAGYSRRLEGIQIVIVNKGASAPGYNFGGIYQNDQRAYIWN